MSGKKPDPKKTKVFGMVHRVAAAIMKRRREALQEVRQECGSLVGDIDPDAVDRDSKDYLFGACEALFHLASACEIREVDSHIIELLMHDDDCWQILNDSVLCKTFV
jgi:hypothetical protein